MIKSFSDDIDIPDHDVCIVGAGPVGIALALACESHGLTVLMLESGGGGPDPVANTLSAGHHVDPARHASPSVAMCRGLGGTSSWWGGRCVAFDPVDFMVRPYALDAAWPIQYEDVSTWYSSAAEFFDIGSSRFQSALGPWSSLQGVKLEDLERWTPEINMGVLHRERLEASDRITVLLGATVVSIKISTDGSFVQSIQIAGKYKRIDLASPRIVIAAGGLESTRLMLVAQRDRPDVLGLTSSALGKYYMGHISGKIADIILDDPMSVSAHDFFLDEGAYVRRRFTVNSEVQLREKVLNTSFWVDNSPFHNFAHRSGVLSLVWLALAIPVIGRRLVSEGVRLSHLGPHPYMPFRHTWNVLTSPFSTVREILKILKARFLSKPKMPGFLVRNRSGRYALHYHAEQSPDKLSTVCLGQGKDSFGLSSLDIKLKFCESDAESVVKSHELIDKALRHAGLGHMEFYQPDHSGRVASVMAQATDGFHQIGTTRMGLDPATSVVDGNCRVHKIDNLYIASSSIFPSSGQANPTFLAVAMAIRLAHHLRLVRDKTAVASECS